MKALGMLVGLFFCACAGCADRQGAKPEKDEKKPESKPMQLIGRIASVPPDKRFVLIQTYERWIGDAGTVLTTRGEGERTANLKITGERMGQFAAADVQAGEVVIGDAVYAFHVPKPSPVVPETPAAVPQTPQNSPAEDVLPPAPDAPLVPELPENEAFQQN